MSYRVLPVHLHAIADHVQQFLPLQWGIPRPRIKVEEPITKEVGFVTTLHAGTNDFHWLCVEVAESAYATPLDAFVLECKNRILPVRLFVATSADPGTGLIQDLARAKRNGVGVIRVANGECEVLSEAVSLSLSGVREPDRKLYPLRYRQVLSRAFTTFTGGNPSKGCSDVYDELETLTRKIARKVRNRAAWRKLPAGKTSPTMNIATGAWAKICQTLLDHLDLPKYGSSKLTPSLLGRVLGVTGLRNDSGHNPTTRAKLIRRDRELRTRFESACDLLLELSQAAR